MNFETGHDADPATASAETAPQIYSTHPIFHYAKPAFLRDESLVEAPTPADLAEFKSRVCDSVPLAHDATPLGIEALSAFCKVESCVPYVRVIHGQNASQRILEVLSISFESWASPTLPTGTDIQAGIRNLAGYVGGSPGGLGLKHMRDHSIAAELPWASDGSTVALTLGMTVGQDDLVAPAYFPSSANPPPDMELDSSPRSWAQQVSLMAGDLSGLIMRAISTAEYTEFCLERKNAFSTPMPGSEFESNEFHSTIHLHTRPGASPAPLRPLGETYDPLSYILHINLAEPTEEVQSRCIYWPGLGLFTELRPLQVTIFHAVEQFSLSVASPGLDHLACLSITTCALDRVVNNGPRDVGSENASRNIFRDSEVALGGRKNFDTFHDLQMKKSVLDALDALERRTENRVYLEELRGQISSSLAGFQNDTRLLSQQIRVASQVARSVPRRVFPRNGFADQPDASLSPVALSETNHVHPTLDLAGPRRSSRLSQVAPPRTPLPLTPEPVTPMSRADSGAASEGDSNADASPATAPPSGQKKRKRIQRSLNNSGRSRPRDVEESQRRIVQAANTVLAGLAEQFSHLIPYGRSVGIDPGDNRGRDGPSRDSLEGLPTLPDGPSALDYIHKEKPEEIVELFESAGAQLTTYNDMSELAQQQQRQHCASFLRLARACLAKLDSPDSHFLGPTDLGGNDQSEEDTPAESSAAQSPTSYIRNLVDLHFDRWRWLPRGSDQTISFKLDPKDALSQRAHWVNSPISLTSTPRDLALHASPNARQRDAELAKKAKLHRQILFGLYWERILLSFINSQIERRTGRRSLRVGSQFTDDIAAPRINGMYQKTTSRFRLYFRVCEAINDLAPPGPVERLYLVPELFTAIFQHNPPVAYSPNVVDKICDLIRRDQHQPYITYVYQTAVELSQRLGMAPSISHHRLLASPPPSRRAFTPSVLVPVTPALRAIGQAAPDALVRYLFAPLYNCFLLGVDLDRELHQTTHADSLVEIARPVPLTLGSEVGHQFELDSDQLQPIRCLKPQWKQFHDLTGLGEKLQDELDTDTLFQVLTIWHTWTSADVAVEGGGGSTQSAVDLINTLLNPSSPGGPAPDRDDLALSPAELLGLAQIETAGGKFNRLVESAEDIDFQHAYGLIQGWLSTFNKPIVSWMVCCDLAMLEMIDPPQVKDYFFYLRDNVDDMAVSALKYLLEDSELSFLDLCERPHEFEAAFDSLFALLRQHLPLNVVSLLSDGGNGVSDIASALVSMGCQVTALAVKEVS